MGRNRMLKTMNRIIFIPLSSFRFGNAIGVCDLLQIFVCVWLLIERRKLKLTLFAHSLNAQRLFKIHRQKEIITHVIADNISYILNIQGVRARGIQKHMLMF
jgi:hypothetical protein